MIYCIILLSRLYIDAFECSKYKIRLINKISKVFDIKYGKINMNKANQEEKMEKFKNYKYERPNMDDLEKAFDKLLEMFREAVSVEKQNEVMEKINEVRNDFETMAELVEIRHSINTTDEFYENENEYFDEVKPVYEGFISKYYESLVESKYKKELINKWGKQLFTLADLQLKSYSEKVISDLQEENKLCSRYNKLIASAKIMFEGEERTLSELTPFMQDKDRVKRKKAWNAYTDFFVQNEDKFDDVYDKLVKVRNTIAMKLGFEDYVGLGYVRLNRSDYNKEMVSAYRKQVLEEIVPLASKLREKQKERLGYEDLMYYDESLRFLTGNPTPKGNPDWIIEKGEKMYGELSIETKEFFEFMINHELLDLVSKKGKASGGYCTYISNYKSPFIFSNFNGTAGDVDVLTHEAGHAFQVYSSREYKIPEYYFPTYEACEIHSMSMEFLTYPWMKEFFEEDLEKYKYYHLSDALLFIPYGVTVDEFQHWVYENPNVTPKERKLKWREIEKKYLPHRNYEDNEFLNKGGFWFKQGHIFASPFYYIDYTLAQVCAFQFYIKSNENGEKAWEDYLRLCKAGGSKSFLELVDLAGLKNPFIDGTIKDVIQSLEDILDAVEDKKL